jgi:hypothetical protein
MIVRTLTLRATVDENRRLTVYLPPGLSEEVSDKRFDDEPAIAEVEVTPAEFERRLREAGLLADVSDIPEDVQELTPEERDRIGRLVAGERGIEELIDEDRGEY